MRKIVHIDMDAFYASVAQRDEPTLARRPVIVAWPGKRSVVLAASYPARAYGVRSAMPAAHAERLCPQAVRVVPDFSRYKAVAQQVQAILQRYTPLVEPLSLDEAYLDVTVDRLGLGSATAVAQAIRRDIRRELGLCASAGVAPNKFLAKIASDWNKPDGLFVIRPGRAAAWLEELPVTRLPGVGRATAARLRALGVLTVRDLRAAVPTVLVAHFGRFGSRLAALAEGRDDDPVVPGRPRRSLSAEDTFERDLPLSALEQPITRLAEKVWGAYRGCDTGARTVVLKLKTAEFRVLTRSLTLVLPLASAAELTATAERLRARVELPAHTRYRLAGVGLTNFSDDRSLPQPSLFPPPDRRDDAG